MDRTLPSESRWHEFGIWIQEQQDQTRPRISDAELARAAGISRQHVGTLKKGESGVRRETVIRIAHALHADVNAACQKAGFQAPSCEITETASHLARRIDHLIRQLPKERQLEYEGKAIKMLEILVSTAA